MLSTTSGSSGERRSPRATPASATAPGRSTRWRAGVPVAAAPHAMPTASSSLSAFMHTPPTAGSLRGHVLEHLGERRHRVAGEEPAAGGDHRLGDRLGPSSSASVLIGVIAGTSIGGCRTCRPGSTKSGQICAHAWQPVQPGEQQRVAVAAGVHVVRRHHEHARRAGVDAEVAALARLDVDDDRARA